MFRIYGSALIAISFIGWIIYQLTVKKKKFGEIKTDMLFILFFIGIWAAIYYWMLH